MSAEMAPGPASAPVLALVPVLLVEEGVAEAEAWPSSTRGCRVRALCNRTAPSEDPTTMYPSSLSTVAVDAKEDEGNCSRGTTCVI